MPDTSLFIAKGESELHLIPKMANRHGLITGATGTGKTVSLQRMAESFSSIGTPVFLSDIKGDLSGICESDFGCLHLLRRKRKPAGDVGTPAPVRVPASAGTGG